jgi:hypothetical protein
MGQGHPRGKHQGGLITVTLLGARPLLQRCAAYRPFLTQS